MNCARTLISSWQRLIRRGRRQGFVNTLRAHIGLEAKLFIVLTIMLGGAVGLSCWVYGARSKTAANELLGQQALQIATTVAQASRGPILSTDTHELKSIGDSLIQNRNILYVTFYDAQFLPITTSQRSDEMLLDSVNPSDRAMEGLFRSHERTSERLGDYLEVIAPVISKTSAGTTGTQSTLAGYVAVGLSQREQHAQVHRINMQVMTIASLTLLLSIPLTILMVRQILEPIKTLVKATRQIADGLLDTRVAIHRLDAIGELSRSFNQMVRKVKRQQEDLARANQTLERKVEDRTRELQSANTRLKTEIHEKNEFMRAVSHDLNAPLRNIAGMATMLLKKHSEEFDEDVIYRLQRIQKNVEVETNLIGELLELSRIKTRRQTFEPVEIDALVRDLSGVFEQDLQANRITFKIDTPLPVLQCEKSRLNQVFQNLIDNAIKYMGDEVNGKVREIHIGCALKPDQAEFYVRDTGQGIDPADVEAIFCVFKRGRGAVARNIAGKGVGLASVKSIIETYDGQIWVESVLNQGTTFRFSIHGRYVPALAGPSGNGIPQQSDAASTTTNGV